MRISVTPRDVWAKVRGRSRPRRPRTHPAHSPGADSMPGHRRQPGGASARGPPRAAGRPWGRSSPPAELCALHMARAGRPDVAVPKSRSGRLPWSVTNRRRRRCWQRPIWSGQARAGAANAVSPSGGGSAATIVHSPRQTSGDPATGSTAGSTERRVDRGPALLRLRIDDRERSSAIGHSGQVLCGCLAVERGESRCSRGGHTPTPLTGHNPLRPPFLIHRDAYSNRESPRMPCHSGGAVP